LVAEELPGSIGIEILLRDAGVDGSWGSQRRTIGSWAVAAGRVLTEPEMDSGLATDSLDLGEEPAAGDEGRVAGVFIGTAPPQANKYSL
jgi:hypothetical protein